MTQTHTPTPWKLDSTHMENDILIRAERATVALVNYGQKNAMANAAFIVRACNRDHAFDALVEALRDVLPKMKLLGAWKEAEKIESALALAEGK